MVGCAWRLVTWRQEMGVHTCRPMLRCLLLQLQLLASVPSPAKTCVTPTHASIQWRPPEQSCQTCHCSVLGV